MMNPRFATRTLLMILACVSTRAAAADEDEIALKAVPAKVLATIKAKFPKAVLKKAYKEVDEGKTIFEIEAEESGKGLDLAVTPDGVITEVERELDPKQLAKPILAAIAAKFPGSTIKSAEAVETLEDGKTVKTIDVVVVDKDRESYDVVLTPDGKILESEESEVDNEKDEK